MTREMKVLDPLSSGNFRNILPEHLLEWGYIYFKNGWVKTEKEILPGLFTVVVNEPCPQEVSFRRTENTLTDMFCTCGVTGFCRHMAAVLFVEENKQL
ncbi:MAG: hypothetical protein IT233_09550 [Bacteroidia bacterium]|nr:hypothetical protein [Bacteroidia bacterium]